MNYNKLLFALLNTQYEKEGIEAFHSKNWTKLNELVIKSNLENKRLLEKLIEKLKGKSVYINLKKLIEGKDDSLNQQKIALSSLFTHCVLEEKVNPRYKVLGKSILHKLMLLTKNDS